METAGLDNWEKIAYKAALERKGFKFTHPFRH